MESNMLPSSRAQRAAIAVAIALAGVALEPSIARAQDPQHAHAQQSPIGIPESMRAEHSEIHQALVRATKAKGRAGAPARDVAKLLDPHFAREEQIALPPLGLLAPLSRGEFTPEMRSVLPMTDSLRAELPRMLEEHKAIRAATLRMIDVARATGNAAVKNLGERLALHAQSEEQLFYPAAVIVGDVVRARSATGTARP